MSPSALRYASLALALSLTACSSFQPAKDVWKGTKDFWYTYVSVPAKVDYAEKGSLSSSSMALVSCVMSVDLELTKLERMMINADRAPSKEWLDDIFVKFPWIGGVAGVRYDGSIIGREPEVPLKQPDFIPLLYEDSKQNSRALRTDVQYTPLGPEILLATPLYDGITFLGVLAVHFDMRNLLEQAISPEDVVIIAPQGLIWSGKFDYASTPLAGVKWSEVVNKSSSGTCSNNNGSFSYLIRWLGNLPLVFAVVESGEFPLASPDASAEFFPQPREPLAPPPLPETAPTQISSDSFGAKNPSTTQDGLPELEESELKLIQQEQEALRKQQEALRKDQSRKQQENKRREELRRRLRQLEQMERQQALEEMQNMAPPSENLEMDRPSPFGPRGASSSSNEDSYSRDAREARENIQDLQTESESSQNPKIKDDARQSDSNLLPSGRPSPFGPR